MNAKLSFTKLLQDRLLFSALVISVASLLLLGRQLLLRTSPSLPPSVMQTYLYEHCPRCQHEVRYDPDPDPQVCEKCHSEVRFVATSRSIHDSGADGRGGRKLAFALISLVILQGLVILGIWRRRVLLRRLEADQNRRLEVRCPFCNRKIAYRAVDAGTARVCSGCKTAFALPDVTEARA